MNYMMSPFSGLSLIIHLFIITLMTLFSLLFPKKNQNTLARKERGQEVFSKRLWKQGLSIFIIVALSALMLFSFRIALQTSIREGSREWHIQYLRHQFANLNYGQFDTVGHAIKNLFATVTTNEYVEAKNAPDFVQSQY